jgi:hypothetical protein
MSWFWLNIPLMLVFFGLWAGIPLWKTLTSWRAELDAKHAELAAAVAVAAPTVVPEVRAAAVVPEADRLAFAGAGAPAGR